MTCFCALLLVEVVLSVASRPTIESRLSPPAQITVLVFILLVGYSLPLSFFFTWRVGGLIRAKLATEGIVTNRTVPLHSRRSFSKWTSRLKLSQEQLVRILEEPRNGIA